MEKAARVSLHQSPDMGFELSYQISCAVVRLCSDDSSYLRSHLREDFLNRLVHDKFAINKASE